MPLIRRSCGHATRASARTVLSPFLDLTREEAQHYDAWYDRPAGRATARAEERLLARLLARLPAGQSVLEVGCGTGHFSRWLSARAWEVTGADPAPAMLAVAVTRSAGPRYVLATAEHLPFADQSVDVVAYITALEFVDDSGAALREAARVSRHGLLLGVLNRASPLGLWRTLAALVRPSVYRHAHTWTPWGLRHHLRRMLGGRVTAIELDTTLWPWWVPACVQRLPFGGFIGLAVYLRAAPAGGEA